MYLKSGSPALTVAERSFGGLVKCVWFHAGQPMSHLLEIEALTDKPTRTEGYEPRIPKVAIAGDVRTV